MSSISANEKRLYFSADKLKLIFKNTNKMSNNNETSKEAHSKALNIADVSGSLPTLEYATKVAVRISEEAITPPLDAKEQGFFIAGFQECIKWLNVVFSNDR